MELYFFTSARGLFQGGWDLLATFFPGLRPGTALIPDNVTFSSSSKRKPGFWQEKTPQYNANPIVPPRMLRFFALSQTPAPRLFLTYRDTSSAVTSFYLLRFYWELGSRARAWDVAYGHPDVHERQPTNATQNAPPPTPRPDPRAGLNVDAFAAWLHQNIATVDIYEACRLDVLRRAGVVAIGCNETSNALLMAFNYSPWSFDYESLETLENHIYANCNAAFKNASYMIQFLTAENTARWAHWRDRTAHWQQGPVPEKRDARSRIFCVHSSCVSAQGWHPTMSEAAISSLAPNQGLGKLLANFLGVTEENEGELHSKPPTVLLEHFFGKRAVERTWPYSLFCREPPFILGKYSRKTSALEMTDNEDAALIANFRKLASERFRILIAGTSIARRAAMNEHEWKANNWCDNGPYRCGPSAET
jgi:hypothetical protein